MTRRLFYLTLVVSLFTFAGFGSRVWAKPAAQAPVGASDLKRLQAEVQQLREQVAQLKNQRAGGVAGGGQAGPGSKAVEEQYINLKNFGAKGDGVTDDTAAIQSALEAAANNAPASISSPQP